MRRDERGERSTSWRRSATALGVERRRLEHDGAGRGERCARGSSARRRARAASGTASARRARVPSAAPEARTWAARLPNVSSTGAARRVVPEVWTTSATSSSRGSPTLNGAPPSSASGWLTTDSASRRRSLRSRAASRGSTGTAGARSSRQACSATTSARPGGSVERHAVAGRGAAPDEPRRPARGGQQQLAVGERAPPASPARRASGRRARCARASQGSISTPRG